MPFRSLAAVLLLAASAIASDLPKNTKIQIRLDQTLSSDRSQTGEKFTATLDRAVSVSGVVLLEKGALVEGVIKYAEPTYNYQQPGELDLELISVRSGGTNYYVKTNLMVLAGKPSPVDPRTGRPMDRGSAGGDLARATIDAATGGKRGTSTTIPGTDLSVGAGAEPNGMQVILPVKSKLTFNLVSATAHAAPPK